AGTCEEVTGEEVTGEEVTGEPGVASTETQVIDTCTLTASFQRLLPQWSMMALLECSENGRGHAQAGDLSVKQVGGTTPKQGGGLVVEQGGSPVIQQFGGSTLPQVELGQ